KRPRRRQEHPASDQRAARSTRAGAARDGRHDPLALLPERTLGRRGPVRDGARRGRLQPEDQRHDGGARPRGAYGRAGPRDPRVAPGRCPVRGDARALSQEPARTPEAQNLAREAARLTLTKRAEDVVILDLRELDGVCDYFVLATGQSEVQTRAISTKK